MAPMPTTSPIFQAALAAVGEAKRAYGSTLPLVASLTTISQTNFRHLVDIYEAFRDKVDLFIFYLSWWIDAERCEAHEVDFRRRFGFDAGAAPAGVGAGSRMTTRS